MASQGSGRLYSASFSNQRYAVELRARRQPERQGEEGDEEEAHADHEAEAPEQRRHASARCRRRPWLISCSVALPMSVAIALQQQRIAQCPASASRTSALRMQVAAVGAHLLQRRVGDMAVADAFLGALDQLVDAGDLGIERARADQAHHPGDLHRVMRRCVASWLGMPKAVKPAGAGSVSHIASIAASFIFWFSVAT